jgi:predicted nucleotidyltransferase
MKFHNILEDILSSRIKISVMKILHRYPEKKFSGRELARMLNVSPSRASEILELFRKYGIANRRRIGNTSEWILNKDSILTKKLSNLFDIEEKIYLDLKSKIHKTLSREKYILKVILYGSVPKGREQLDSDIDLFILVKNQKDKELAAELIHKLNISLLPRYGNVISELIYSKEEWKLKKNSNILKQIQSEGEIIFEIA